VLSTIGDALIHYWGYYPTKFSQSYDEQINFQFERLTYSMLPLILNRRVKCSDPAQSHNSDQGQKCPRNATLVSDRLLEAIPEVGNFLGIAIPLYCSFKSNNLLSLDSLNQVEDLIYYQSESH